MSPGPWGYCDHPGCHEVVDENPSGGFDCGRHPSNDAACPMALATTFGGFDTVNLPDGTSLAIWARRCENCGAAVARTATYSRRDEDGFPDGAIIGRTPWHHTAGHFSMTRLQPPDQEAGS